ncbi:MAG: ABC transporter permease [Deltaproteobacteria bacterium]|nr:ABC transporter permease [Deltaproteobacteria bacterium]
MRRSSLARVFAGGAVSAAAVLLGQWGCASALEFLPLGTRAQATGVALSTMILLLVGFAIGLRARHRTTVGQPSSFTLFGLLSGPDLEQDDPAASRALPKGVVWTAAGFLFLFGIAGYAMPWAPAGVSLASAHEGGMSRAMFGIDATLLGPALFLTLGGMLGLHTRAFTVLASMGGLAMLAGGSFLGGYLARYASYDANTIAALTVLGVVVASLGTGFVLAWIRQRLAFVELSLVALYAGYGVFLTASIGPASLLKSFNLPEEQVFLALASIPLIAVFALLTVGSSVGFLLHGGGRFDPGFRYEFGVALRYLRAHRRDGMVGVVTTIAVVGVMLGVTALVVVLSVMSGFEEDLKQKILGAHAHIVIGKHGDDFTEYEEVEEELKSLPGIDTVASFVLGDAMISTDAGLSGTLVKGIDPTSWGATRDLRKAMVQGRLEYLADPGAIPGARGLSGFGLEGYQPSAKSLPPSADTGASASAAEGANAAAGGSPGAAATSGATTEGQRAAEGLALGIGVPLLPKEDRAKDDKIAARALPGILIGRELKKTLRVNVGDTVKLVSPISEEIGPMGPTPKLRRFRVAGIFYSGMYEYDAKFTYIEMGQAQRFLGSRGRVTGIELKMLDIDDTAELVEALRRRLGGYPYTVRDWREMNKELFSALLLEKLAMFIGLTMIIMVASFLIVATLVMIVLQRGKEIAILKSIGASDASVMKMFVVQGVIVGVGGALLGVVLGLVLCVILGRFVSLDENMFYIAQLPVVVDSVEVAAIGVCAVVISYLATIYPAMTAAQLRPVEGLRDD